jgi:diguanylate cyclase (GGDEF)-like protein
MTPSPRTLAVARVLRGVIPLGLTQPRWTTTLLLPALGAAWWLAIGEHTTNVVVRLPLSIIIWVLVGELLASRTNAQAQESSLLRTHAEHDPVTGLANRRGLDEALPELPVGAHVLFIDLDHFKRFNDNYGHDAGDQLLRRFGACLATTVRSTDIVARYGGEEFVVLTHEPVDPQQLHDRLQANWQAADGAVTFSAGTSHRRAGEDPRVCLRRADDALYVAQRQGRARMVHHVPATLPTSPTTTSAATGAAPGSARLARRDDHYLGG